MKSLLFILLLSSAALFSQEENDEESLFVRRIYALWQDKEAELAKKEIEEFKKKFPKSDFTDPVTAILGDIAFHDKLYEEAISYYEQIQDAKISKSVEIKKWHAQHLLKRYSELIVEITAFAIEKSFEARFLYADSCFREGCLNASKDLKKAKLHWQEALSHFEKLLENPTYCENAKLASAEIYRLIGEPQVAAKFYLEIVDSLENKEINKSEDVLLHAAYALKDYDSTKAVKIASHLSRFGLKRRKEAAALWFHLLVKEEKYEEIHFNETFFLQSLNAEQKGLYHLALGKNYSEKKEYAFALEHLEKSLSYPMSRKLEEQALLALMKVSLQMRQYNLCSSTYHLYKQKFEKEALNRSDIEIIYASALIESEKFDKAQDVLHNAIIDHPEKGDLYLEKAKLFALQKKYKDAAEICQTIIDKWPENKPMLTQTLNISLNFLSEIQDEPLREKLTVTIERTLGIAGLFSKEEKQKAKLFLAKSYLSLKRPEKAIHILNNLSSECYEPSEVHFLLAIAYFQDPLEKEKAIIYAEKALDSDDSTFERRKLHLYLFNAYLDLAKEGKDEKFESYAANHLYAICDEMPITLENRLWLFNFFIRKNESFLDEKMAEKAICTFEPLLTTDGDYQKFELECIQLATLYESLGLYKEEKALLEKLKTMSLASNGLWQYTEERSLKEADLYALSGSYEKAYALYQSLEESNNLKVSYEAQLKLARLFFARFPKNPKMQQIAEAQEILKKLKDLKIHKNLKTEPLHLEAAIDYAEFSSLLVMIEERNLKLLSLLLEAKEEFQTADDIWSKDYQQSLYKMPDKARLHAAYMRFLDAKIYHLQAQVARNEGNLIDSNTKEKAAFALFSSLRQGKYAVTRYIKDKAQLAMK